MNTNTDNEEPYLTIKELSFELYKRNLPYSRKFINKIRHKAGFICNRARLSEVLAVLKKDSADKYGTTRRN